MLAALTRKLRELAVRSLPPHLRNARRGEDLAYAYLRKQNYTIVARNYRPHRRKEEVDLIGWDGPHLAVIEVKTRQNLEFGRPDRAVDAAKQRHLFYAAEEYARRARIHPARIRYDVVSVVLSDPPEIRLYKDAFTRRGRGRRPQ